MVAAPIHSELQRLFPAGTAICVSAEPPLAPELLPGELSGTEAMVARRRLEFAHGRDCARGALGKLGLEAVAIPKGANREPLWPAGVVGSISHTAQVAAAVAAHDRHLAGIGLDMELQEPLEDNLIAMICRPGELPDGDGARAKLLFSIKEAIYKCIYPQVGTYVDFQEMEVQLNPAEHSFRAISRCPQCPTELTERLRGGYAVIEGLVLAGAWLDT